MRSRYVRFGSLGMLDTEVVMRGRGVCFSGGGLICGEYGAFVSSYTYILCVRARMGSDER